MIYPQNFEQKIGFDQIRQLLKDKCLSTLGEERVTDMNFSEQHEEVEEKLNQVTEFVRIIQEDDVAEYERLRAETCQVMEVFEQLRKGAGIRYGDDC